MSPRLVPAGRTRFLVRDHGPAAGTGTPVLLLHGVPETSACWDDIAARIAPGRRVLAPDLPGLGGSAYDGPFDVASLVAELAALVEAECSGGPVDVVGHDWGGVLALALTAGSPGTVRRLCVVNAPYRQVPVLRMAYAGFFATPVLPELVFRAAGRQLVDAMLRAGWRSSATLPADRRQAYVDAYADPSRTAAMLGYYRGVVRARAKALLPGVGGSSPAPPRVRAERMLVLWGALDPALPIRIGEAVVRDLGPECAMVTVPGAGHFVLEEAPDVVASVLADFLAEDRPAGS